MALTLNEVYLTVNKFLQFLEINISNNVIIIPLLLSLLDFIEVSV